MEHTKAPWKVRTLGDDCFVEGNEIVGKTITGEYKREIMSDEDYPSKLADAHLIAAAPELLEVCKELLADIEHNNSDFALEHDMDGHDENSCIICSARKIIRKAEGKP